MAKELKTPKVEIEIESETDFLNRLLYFQHEGGWGKQLDPMITERIKLINKSDVAQPKVEEVKEG